MGIVLKNLSQTLLALPNVVCVCIWDMVTMVGGFSPLNSVAALKRHFKGMGKNLPWWNYHSRESSAKKFGANHESRRGLQWEIWCVSHVVPAWNSIVKSHSDLRVFQYAISTNKLIMFWTGVHYMRDSFSSKHGRKLTGLYVLALSAFLNVPWSNFECIWDTEHWKWARSSAFHAWLRLESS